MSTNRPKSAPVICSDSFGAATDHGPLPISGTERPRQILRARFVHKEWPRPSRLRAQPCLRRCFSKLVRFIRPLPSRGSHPALSANEAVASAGRGVSLGGCGDMGGSGPRSGRARQRGPVRMRVRGRSPRPKFTRAWAALQRLSRGPAAVPGQLSPSALRFVMNLLDKQGCAIYLAFRKQASIPRPRRRIPGTLPL